tara:strand:- start:44212 stop:46677 length:2466 start_codon:yes stop_codon:yes gene_type:complete
VKYFSTILVSNFLLLNFLFPNNFIDLKKNITSLLNTKDIVEFNSNIIVSTTGGVYGYSNNIFLENLNYSNISFIKSYNDNLYIGSGSPTAINIFDKEFNLISFLEYPEFDHILDISISEDYIFASGLYNQSNILIKYSFSDDNHIQYVNYFDTFPITFESINDLLIKGENIYLATSNGVISASFESSTLSLSSSWDVNFENINIISIIDFQDSIYFSYENKITDINNNDLVTFLNGETIKKIDIISDQLLIITNQGVYNYYFEQDLIEEHNLPDEYTDNICCFLKLNDILYYGVQNKGILTNVNDEWVSYVPNTIYKNQFDAITLLDDGSLFGIVNHRNDINQSGGFIYKNPLLNNSNLSISNFYSFNGFNINKYPLSSGDFIASVLNYWSGDNTIHSVVSSGNEIIFSNSGVYPKSWLGHYNQVANDFSFNLSDSTFYGGLIKFTYNESNNSIILDDYYSLENNILGGNNGIFNSSWRNGFMTINQIKYDNNNNNLWIANPFSEFNNNSIAINSGDDWYHIQDNFQGYIPKEFSFDKNNNLWISYLFSETMDNSSPYSPGGVRMVEYKDILNYSDDIWHINWLDELQGLNIWSLIISVDNYGNEILWVMTDYGIMGYILHVSYTYSGNIMVDFTRIQENFYFSELNFDEGCKIRLDKNNNLWITTKSDGIRVLKNNGEYFNSNLGIINKDSHNILSNIIYDIVFDDYGNVFIATEMGISILETSFNRKNNENNIGVSPNPFIIGEDSEIIFSNVSSDAIIKVISLNGSILKTFNMEDYSRNVKWNGKSDNGRKIPSGIYLLSSYDRNLGSKTTKLAIINK